MLILSWFKIFTSCFSFRTLFIKKEYLIILYKHILELYQKLHKCCPQEGGLVRLFVVWCPFTCLLWLLKYFFFLLKYWYLSFWTNTRSTVLPYYLTTKNLVVVFKVSSMTHRSLLINEQLMICSSKAPLIFNFPTDRQIQKGYKTNYRTLFQLAAILKLLKFGEIQTIHMHSPSSFHVFTQQIGFVLPCCVIC